ncbi:MAG TPA: DeoR family transcriptional regulator, partial [Chitinophagaceae bacterium]|nr:DeoR family transcriptional regulator [Chitinophagaceae bacterium]
RKMQEKKRSITLLRNTNFNERQIRLLQEILHDQTSNYSVKQLEEWFKVSNQTVRNDLNELVEAGLLEFRKAGKQLLYFPGKDFITNIQKMNR